MGTTLTGQKIKDTYKSLIKISDNTEASASAKQLSDGNGNDFGIYIDTDGVVGIGGAASYSLDISSKTDGVSLPVGTTANRPTGTAGLIRYNSATSKLEYYDTAFKLIASETYVNTQINNLIDSAPGTLDTLNEIAAALNDDPDFYNTITALIADKQDTITGAATTITDTDLTASKALISNASGKVAVSTVSDTELGYISGVTSAVQTQINSKQDTLTAGTGIDITGTTISTNLTNLIDTGAIQADAVTAVKMAQFDDLLSAATAGDILVSNGTDFDNVTVTGDVTINSSGVTAIGADKIDEANLKATNAPTDNYILSYDAATSGFTWVESSGGGATTFVVDTFNGDGSTVAFNLSNTIANENNLQVYINGVYQSKSNYSTIGTTLTFSTAPATGTNNIEVTHAVSIGGTPSIEVDTFNGDGSTVGFTLTTEPATKNNLQIYIDGVYQAKANYSVSGTTLTFTTAPQTGTGNIEVTHIKLS